MTRPEAEQVSCGPSTLFLPLSARGSVWLACAALFLYYAASMARDLSLYDSGEIALAAVQLGLGHPPGQPLHTLLGFAFAHLPFVPPLVGVALVSALPGALALVPAASLAQGLSGAGGLQPRTRLIAWLLAAIAVHPIVWEPATRIEVYGLATFLALWAVARIAAPPPPKPVACVLQAAVALGLCASVNPMIALCTGIALAPGLLARIARRQLPARALWAALLGGALGLLPYAYVPLVAERTDVLIWGAPRDAGDLWNYLSVRDYAHNRQITLPSWWEHMLGWLRFAAERGLLPLVALGAVAHVWLGGRSLLGRATAPGLLLLLVAFVSSNVVWHLDVPDYNGYVASGLWLMAAGAAAFVARASDLGRPRVARALAALLALVSFAAPPHVLERTRHRDRVARELAEQVLREAPPEAIVIASSDYLAGALLYLQEAERRRGDVVVLVYGLASSSWHWQHIYRRHRELAAFPLLGPGGKPARVRRFIAANGSRPLLLERISIASELGVRACPGGLYLRAGPACERAPATNARPAALLARALRGVGDGSPSTDGAIAETAYEVGEAWWRLGSPRAAYEVLLAGVPPAMQARPAAASPALDRVPPLAQPLPAWRRAAALGDPARNLFVAGVLAHAAGLDEAALAHLRAAALDGLPEALDLLAARDRGAARVIP